MRSFDLKSAVLALSSPNIISLLNSIEMYRGKTLSVKKIKKEERLLSIARKSDVLTSCSLGNIYMTDQQVRALFERKKPATTFGEFMVLGYSKALDLINEVSSFQPFDMNFICTLHYYMYKEYNPELGGVYKNTQNYIVAKGDDGEFKTIFVPSSPEDSPILMERLLKDFNKCAQDEEVNKLLLISTFLVDFMCIHPFAHGNGRLSRLILAFLLKKFGYDINSYYSLSYYLQEHVQEYTDAFENSSNSWHENKNDYSVYIAILLKGILETYKRLDYVLDVTFMHGTADDKILKIITESDKPIAKLDIQNILYAASSATIEKGLAKLQKDGLIQLVTKGRYSKYFRV